MTVRLVPCRVRASSDRHGNTHRMRRTQLPWSVRESASAQCAPMPQGLAEGRTGRPAVVHALEHPRGESGLYSMRIMCTLLISFGSCVWVAERTYISLLRNRPSRRTCISATWRWALSPFRRSRAAVLAFGTPDLPRASAWEEIATARAMPRPTKG